MPPVWEDTMQRKTLWIFGTLALLLTLLLCAAPLSAQDIAALLANLRPSVVSLTAYDADGTVCHRGSGFFIERVLMKEKKRFLVAPTRLLLGAARAQVTLRDGTSGDVQLVANAKFPADILLLTTTLPDEKTTPLTLATERAVENLQLLLVAPEQTDLDDVTGKVVTARNTDLLCRVALPITPEVAGSPLVDQQGQVNGIAFLAQDMKRQHFALCTDGLPTLPVGTGSSLTDTWARKEWQGWTIAVDDRYYAGMTAVCAREYSRALDSFEKALAILPGNVLLLEGKGICYFALNRDNLAIETFQQIIKAHPEYLSASKHLAWYYTRENRHDEVIRVLKKTLDYDRNDKDIYLLLGASHAKREEYKEAISAYKQAIGLGEKSAATYFALGTAANSEGQLTDAVNALRESVRLDPHNEQAYTLLCQAYTKCKQYADMTKACEQWVKYYPNSLNAYDYLGDAYLALGRGKDAVAVLKKALDLNEKRVPTLVRLVQAYCGSGDYYKAIKLSEHALTQKTEQNDTIVLYSYQGFAYAKLGLLREAVIAYGRALKLKPEDGQLWHNLGMVKMRFMQYRDAINAFNLAISVGFRSVETYQSLGTAYMRMEQYQEADKAYKEALRLDPKNGETYLQIGLAYFNQGDKEAAMQIYETLKTLDPERAERLSDVIFKTE